MSATPNKYWRTCSMRRNHTPIRLAVMRRVLSSFCLEQTLTSSKSTAWALQEVRRNERVDVRVAVLAPQRVQPEQTRRQLVERVQLLPLPSVCWCCGRAVCVCVCVLPWNGVCVVRGVRRTVHAWLLPSRHVVCPLCVSAAPLVSPVALHVPHCADQLHSTERPHSR
ncbi:mucin TcMUC [Trypanosoma cruzi]|nr:mucin TcMUC [Trypanosoma cruzi]